MKKFFALPVLAILLIDFISAHCPLCTVGAGAAAGAAVWLGVSKVVAALFIGAFAMSMGIWFSKIPKKEYILFQKIVIVAIIFLSTVLPLLPMFKVIGPLYIYFIGEYGNTYAINYSLASVIFGGLIVISSPTVSKRLTKLRKGRRIPFQGVVITLFLLVVLGGAIQLLI